MLLPHLVNYKIASTFANVSRPATVDKTVGMQAGNLSKIRDCHVLFAKLRVLEMTLKNIKPEGIIQHEEVMKLKISNFVSFVTFVFNSFSNRLSPLRIRGC